jgi:hypothetical protein
LLLILLFGAISYRLLTTDYKCNFWFCVVVVVGQTPDFTDRRIHRQDAKYAKKKEESTTKTQRTQSENRVSLHKILQMLQLQKHLFLQAVNHGGGHTLLAAANSRELLTGTE